MNTHNGNHGALKKDRALHRFRFPKTFWEWIEKSYVIFAFSGIFFTLLAFQKDDPFRAKAFLVAVLVFFFAASLVAVAGAWINGEKARYAETVESLHQCLHSIRDLDIYLTHLIATVDKQTKTSEVKGRVQYDLTRVLDRVVTSISLVSGVGVKAMITQVVPDNSRLRVEVFARDSSSRDQWKHQDEPKVDHWVDDNTSLRKIVVNKEVSYYYIPNVLSNQDYDSSFFKHWPHDAKYQSCLVLPIRGKDLGIDDHQYCGFLHIESMSRRAFNTRYDVDICAAVADSLYLVLSHYATQCRMEITHANA